MASTTGAAEQVVTEELGGSPTLRQWVGVIVMLACLAVEGWAAHELVRRWRTEAASRSPVAATTGGDPSGEPVTMKAVGEVSRSGSSAP